MNSPTFAVNTPIAWLNGEYLLESSAALPVTDLGVVGGLAVSEMSRTFAGQIFRLTDHLERLRQSLKLVDIALPYSERQICETCTQVVTHNFKVVNTPEVIDSKEIPQELGVVIFVTAGPNPTYMGQEYARQHGPSVGIHTFCLRRQAYHAMYRDGVSLVCPPVQALPAEIVPRTIKSRSRMHWRMGELAARKIDPHSFSILADNDGSLTETAAGNLVIIQDNCAISPPEGQALEGISLKATLEFCHHAGLTVERRRIWPKDLMMAQEAWLTSTPFGMVPVTRFDGHTVGAGPKGPWYRKILHQWSEATGCDLAQWLGSENQTEFES